MRVVLNPSPDDKILALSKLKTLADAKLNVMKSIKIVFHSERILPASSPFPTIFSKDFSEEAS